jgi:hypothetical protein
MANNLVITFTIRLLVPGPTNVFSQKTRTLYNQLSVGSVNSNRADFEPDSKLPDRDSN